MCKALYFVTRKPQAQYFSIEGVFNTIITALNVQFTTQVQQTTYAGVSPLILLKNALAFKTQPHTLYHITGDVHYMALATGRNTVLTIHDVGSALQGSMLKGLYVKLFWFWLPALVVKRITVISEFTKHQLVGVIPFATSKITVVPNPVDKAFVPSAYTFKTTCPTILCIGTKANKNLERTIEAAANLSCTLHIIGVLNLAQLKLLKQHKIAYTNSVNLSQAEIVQAYQHCDLLCFPSTYEGFGMPIIEAQAVGRPVITAHCGAMLEVAGASAALVDPLDVAAIKASIVQIIEDAAHRERLIQMGFENIKRFSLEAVVEKYKAIYNSMLTAG